MKLIDKFESTHTHRFDEVAPAVIEKLKVLPRTGWLQCGIEDPETVYEHISATRRLAVEYKDELGLTDSELYDLLDILEIHDWPETLVGDGVIFGDEENVDSIRAHKEAREMEAMETICESLTQGDEILMLYKRYAKGSDRIAKLAKQLEKLQAVYKAAEYENEYGIEGLTKEFDYYSKDLIHESFLKKEMEKVVRLFKGIPRQLAAGMNQRKV